MAVQSREYREKNMELWYGSNHVTDLAKVPPGDGDSVGDTGQVQPGSDVYGTTGTPWFNAGLIGRIISL